MNSFLQGVSQNILNTFDNLKSIEIIVPNRRTGLFLKKAITGNVSKITWMPRITPIQEIFINNSKLIQTENLILIYHLYTIFKKHTGTSESFDDFYYWGETILSDFDDIDKYLVDAEKLFTTIKDIKEIDKNFDGYDENELEIIKRFWVNINQANISTHKEKFLSLWEKMFDIYDDFKKFLIGKGIAYQGLIYRNIAQKISSIKFEKSSYVVVGFNALNKCEKALFQWLKANRETYFFWDADLYYLKDEYQEAGRFLRENIRKFSSFGEIGIIKEINHSEKDIEIIAAPSPISQVKIIPRILDNWKKQADFDPEKTAIILADENLLIPLMYSIPDYIETYNVSMGFPVKNSATAAFIIHLTSLQYNSRFVSSENDTKFYQKDILSIINHSFIRSLFPKESEKIESFISRDRLIYVNSYDLQVSDFFEKLFKRKYSEVSEMSSYILDVCSELVVLLSRNEEFAIELEFLNRVTNRVSVLNDCINYEDLHISKYEIFFKLLSSSIKNLSVAFEGEPLKGLQVLGFLETRCLDFDRIIMLSINEGVFPKNSATQSFIPYNLRRFYELPSIEFQDSIFAYYFYRSIQRAKDIKIIYSSQSGDSPAEASRFISQIKYEFDRSVNNIKFSNDGYKVNINSRFKNYASKTDDVLDVIAQQLQNGISPKAINEYLNCSFRYYLNYVKKIKEPEKIEEAEDGAFFGKLFHKIMQHLYEPYIGKVLVSDDFEKIASSENIKQAVFFSLKEVFSLKYDFEIEKYYNKIIVDIVLKYITRLIEFDRNSIPLTILGLEEEYNFLTQIKGFDKEIKVKGFIDRVDLLNGVYRVLDYKTGSVETKIAGIEQIFEDNRNYKYSAVTQVFLYALMLNSDDGKRVCPGVFNVNKLGTGYDYRISISKAELDYFDSELKDSLVEKLHEMFSQMLNPSVDFVQTENIENCKYCPYNIICDKS